MERNEENGPTDRSPRLSPLVGVRSLLGKITLKQIIFILSLILIEIGCNICMEIPGSLEVIITKTYNLSSTQFSLFYSLYFLPPMFNNAIGGFLIDKWFGIKWTTVIYGIIALAGLALFVLGGALQHFWLMLLGRLIFGLGNEITTGVSITYCIYAWYNGIMNFASSMYFNVSILGNLIVYQVAPKLFNNLQQSMNSKKALDIVLFLISLVYIPTLAVAFVMVVFLGPRRDEEVTGDDPAENAMATDQNKESINLSDVLKFPAVYWVLLVMNLLTYSMSTFQQYSQGLFTGQGLTFDEASNAVTIFNLTIIILSIPTSILVDKFGRNTVFVTVGLIFCTLTHVMLACSVYPYAPMFCLGLGRALSGSAVLPMFAYPLDKNLCGTCYGLMGTVTGFSLSVSPVIVGAVIDRFGYDSMEYFYITAGSLAILCMVIVWILDSRSTGILNMTPGQRKELVDRLNCLKTQELLASNSTPWSTSDADLIIDK